MESPLITTSATTEINLLKIPDDSSDDVFIEKLIKKSLLADKQLGKFHELEGDSLVTGS